MNDGDRARPCIITGATSGIGRATAEALARRGVPLVLVGRSAGRLREATGSMRALGAPRAEGLVADLSSLGEVRRVAEELRGRFLPAAALLNNAGAVFLRRQPSADGHEMTWALNHLSPFLLTTLLLDDLRAAGPVRVVNVASGAHAEGRIDFDDPSRQSGPAAYAQSKLANVMFTLALARRLEGSGATANAIHPGWVASGFGANNGWIWSVARHVVHRGAIPPEAAAPAVVRLLADPALAGVSGRYFDREHERAPAPQARDAAACERLWALSARQTTPVRRAA